MTASTWTILDRAQAALHDASVALTAADLGRATPCAEWTVARCSSDPHWSPAS